MRGRDLRRSDRRARSRLRRIASALALAALAACTTISVSTEHDEKADFSKLESWRWHDEPSPRPDLPGFDEAVFDRNLRAAVERELAAKGYVRRDQPPTDFEVGYHTAVESKMDYQGTRDYYGYATGTPIDRPSVGEYLEGTLLLDVSIDGGTRLIWRGQAQARLYVEGTEAERRARLDEAVHRMLSGFPP